MVKVPWHPRRATPPSSRQSQAAPPTPICSQTGQTGGQITPPSWIFAPGGVKGILMSPEGCGGYGGSVSDFPLIGGLRLTD